MISVPALRDGAPGSLVRRVGGGGAGSVLRPGALVPRVHDVPGNHRGAAAPAPRAVQAARARTSTSVTRPSASIPATRRGLENTPRSYPGSTPSRCVARGSTARWSRRSSRWAPGRAEAGQAAREHLRHGTSRWSAAGDVRRRPQRRHLAGDRRGIDEAVGYLRFTPGPGWAVTCLPVDPSYLSWRVRRRLGHPVPVRGAGQRRQRAHAGLRGPAHHRAVEQQLAAGAQRPHPAARHRVQGRPRTGASRPRSRSPSGSRLGAGSAPATAHPRGAPAGPDDGPRRLHARGVAPRTWCSFSWTIRVRRRGHLPPRKLVFGAKGIPADARSPARPM
jgi:hypothetical protein